MKNKNKTAVPFITFIIKRRMTKMEVCKYSYRKILKVISLLIIFLLFSSSFASEIGTSKGGSSNLEKHKKNAAKFFFIEDVYRRKEMGKYVDVVWNRYVKHELKSEEIKMFNISKENIILILVDLNGDGKKDILTSVVKNSYFCGKYGRDCRLVALISSKTHDYIKIESCISAYWEEFPVYVLNSLTNGLRDIIVNDKFILKFDGKEYCYKN